MSAYTFKECPMCSGYGVRDSGHNCTTCGGVGAGGLRSPRGACIGSGELIVETETGRIVTPEEFAQAINQRDLFGGGDAAR